MSPRADTHVTAPVTSTSPRTRQGNPTTEPVRTEETANTHAPLEPQQCRILVACLKDARRSLTDLFDDLDIADALPHVKRVDDLSRVEAEALIDYLDEEGYLDGIDEEAA